MIIGLKGVPHLVTHDARTIRYPDPMIKVNDTVQVDIATGKIKDFIKFDSGENQSRMLDFFTCISIVFVTTFYINECIDCSQNS